MSAFGGSRTYIDITYVFDFADLLPPRLPWPNLPAIRQALADDVAAKLAKFCIQYPPLAGMGAGTIENARIRVRRLSVLRRDYAACADSIPRGIIAGDIRM